MIYTCICGSEYTSKNCRDSIKIQNGTSPYFQKIIPWILFWLLVRLFRSPILTATENRKNLVLQVHCQLISSLILIILFLVLCELNLLPVRIRSHAHRQQCLVLADFISEIGMADQRISTFVMWRHHRAVFPLPFDS